MLNTFIKLWRLHSEYWKKWTILGSTYLYWNSLFSRYCWGQATWSWKKHSRWWSRLTIECHTTIACTMATTTCLYTADGREIIFKGSYLMVPLYYHYENIKMNWHLCIVLITKLLYGHCGSYFLKLVPKNTAKFRPH